MDTYLMTFQPGLISKQSRAFALSIMSVTERDFGLTLALSEQENKEIFLRRRALSLCKMFCISIMCACNLCSSFGASYINK